MSNRRRERDNGSFVALFGFLSIGAVICLLSGVAPSARIGVWVLIGFVCVLGLLVFVLLDLNREARWRREGRCRVCGYDLRETPHRCPECGCPSR